MSASLRALRADITTLRVDAIVNAQFRSGRDAVAGAPFLGGFPERGEEAGIGGVELFSHAEGDRVEERRG